MYHVANVYNSNRLQFLCTHGVSRSHEVEGLLTRWSPRIKKGSTNWRTAPKVVNQGQPNHIPKLSGDQATPGPLCFKFAVELDSLIVKLPRYHSGPTNSETGINTNCCHCTKMPSSLFHLTPILRITNPPGRLAY